MNNKLNALALAIGTSLLLSACGGSNNKADRGVPPTPAPPAPAQPAEPPKPQPLTIGLLPDTQGGTDAQGQAHVALHPMREVLKHQQQMGANLVIALGDLTDKGSDVEFAEWTSAAKAYAEQGIEFLPVMGNHETSYAYTYNWIENMKQYIPQDAVHMPGYEWVNYYVIRENVMIIGLAYYNLPVAFEWIEQVVNANEDNVDHIVVASHDGLIGAKYGQTREQIVDGTKDDDWVYSVQPKIRDFFAEKDVIYVQGHEHQYQRSLIAAKTVLTSYPSSSTPTGGNYRMDVYTQIMAGNASYKGYEFRYGERDLVQMIVSQKNRTDRDNAPGYDVNSSLLTFNDQRIDYQSYYATHNAHSNVAEDAFSADWALLDQFSRTTNRCETVIYANSILEETRPVMVLQPEYKTNDCHGDDGSYASLKGGVNNTFNRTDSRTRDMGYTPGFTRAETLNDLVRLAYQWLFQVHQRWSPNLNSVARAIPDQDSQELVIPETTIDLKEHVTLSWRVAEDTASDILIVSGTQNQTGMYQDDYGVEKDLEVDPGLAMSRTDGDAKQPHTLPSTATKSWNIANAVADDYALVFTAAQELDAANHRLAILGQAWSAIAPDECVVQGTWNETYLAQRPEQADGCNGYPLVGYDADFGNRWWVVLNRDAEVALIAK